jgi:hypothetical protein
MQSQLAATPSALERRLHPRLGDPASAIERIYREMDAKVESAATQGAAV